MIDAYQPELILMKTVIIAAIALPLLLVLDFLWIGIMGDSLYRAQLGSMLRPDVLWPAALAFYLLYAAALSHFVITPSVTLRVPARAALSGAFFGLVAYGTYDFTNLATITGWPLPLTLIDLVWGMVLTAAVSVATYAIAKKLLRY